MTAKQIISAPRIIKPPKDAQALIEDTTARIQLEFRMVSIMRSEALAVVAKVDCTEQERKEFARFEALKHPEYKYPANKLN